MCSCRRGCPTRSSFAPGAAVIRALQEAGVSAKRVQGQFRGEHAPRGGDKKTYQMNPANRREALIEADLDTQEGADFLMVKPALAYLDVIRRVKDDTGPPLCAYHTSGEYGWWSRDLWPDTVHRQSWPDRPGSRL